MKTKVLILLTIPLTLLTGCSHLADCECSSLKRLTWSEKEKKYGSQCEERGLEKGTLDFYDCVNELSRDEFSLATKEENPSSSDGVAFPWEIQKSTDKRVEHNYGRPTPRPRTPLKLDRSLKW